MYKLLVRPILEYGAQVLIYRNYFLSSKSRQSCGIIELTAHEKKLENFQTQSLKRLLNCQRYVPPAIVRLFAGVEPLIARLDFLKLRYYWRLLKTNQKSFSKRVYDIRKRDLLSSNKGFLHEALNLCSKYKTIDIWHGRCRRNINPLRWIKQVVVKHNLNKDLNASRKKSCSFSILFLKNPFIYQKTYHILEPFLQVGQFSSSNTRSRFLKALLDTCSFTHPCDFCGESFHDLLQHQLFNCSRLTRERTKLFATIQPHISKSSIVTPLTDKHIFFAKSLTCKHILKPFTDFLQSVNY